MNFERRNQLDTPKISRRTMLVGSAAAATTLALPATAAQAVPSYITGTLRLTELPWELLPYNYRIALPLDRGQTFDAEGIVVRRINGIDYDHPVAQAQFMMQALSSYHHNRQQEYLNSVIKHARRMKTYAIRDDGKTLLPYKFPFFLHGRQDGDMGNPWFSAMAQGQALGAIARLYEFTNDEEWAEFAQELFASLASPDTEGTEHAVSIVDRDGFLWFEEYPKAIDSDKAFNGHIFAIYGLYDYWRILGREVASNPIKGGISSVLHYFPQMRNPGGVSHYCMRHRVESISYHNVHVEQLYKISQMAQSRKIAAMHDSLLLDYPTHTRGGAGYVSAGTYTLLRLDSSRAVIGRRSATLSAPRAVQFVARAKPLGEGGVWLQMTGHDFDAWWIRETPNRVFVKLAIEGYRYDPPREVTIEAGKYTAYKFNRYGVPDAPLTRRLAAKSGARVRHRLINNGREYYLVHDGMWADHWLPAQDGIHFMTV